MHLIILLNYFGLKLLESQPYDKEIYMKKILTLAKLQNTIIFNTV